MKAAFTAVLLVAAFPVATALQSPELPPPGTVDIPWADAQPVVEALREDLLPAELRGGTDAGRAAAWPAWVRRHDEAIRARLDRGDEDSLVNFLLFGTSFTPRPRATERDLAQLAPAHTDGVPGPLARRIDDLLDAVRSPGANERLQFARDLLQRRGLDPASAAARDYLVASLLRVSAEMASLSARRLNDSSLDLADRLTRFRDRGLSSDASIFPAFGVHRALEQAQATGLLDAGSVTRLAIVGPGLDFTDKHEGYDFYPQQTIQPFAIVDSLLRLGLSDPDALQVTTFDLSPRVNHHLAAARDRAREGLPYVLQLPRSLEPPWTPPLVAYWEQVGARIGNETPPPPVPPGAGEVRVRAIRVRPGVVAAIAPQDLNVVLQRLAPLDDDQRFDVIVATNVLAYYDVFEQSLALANVARMLRPGGLFVTNNGVFELPPIPLEWKGFIDVGYMQVPDVGETIDRLFWYQRQ